MSGNMKVRGLTSKDQSAVEEMDEKSGNNLSYLLGDLEEGEESDYGFGLFDGDKLIGYCSIGGADDVTEEIENDELYEAETSLMLSDVYIMPEYRGRDLGIYMINEAMDQRVALEKQHGPECEPKSIYLTLLYDNLCSFYEKAGFHWLDESEEYCMVKDLAERKLEREEKEMD